MEYTIKPFGKWYLLKDKATGRVIFKGKSRRDIDDYLEQLEKGGE